MGWTSDNDGFPRQFPPEPTPAWYLTSKNWQLEHMLTRMIATTRLRRVETKLLCIRACSPFQAAFPLGRDRQSTQARSASAKPIAYEIFLRVLN